ncbi:hypothetical protein Z043_125329 [Scleropages formosus]|uniref:Phosphoinositide phospholipase C n=1 Tax=Scleropages formosus TaxID=113540 RepID=A0A0P7UDR9_SCLFO|nr:hypothetical protein Z043_125329 [Scleropages formosus]
MEVLVTDVECVREGCQSEVLRSLGGAVPEGQCFTLLFRGGRKSLDLRCSTEEEARRWVRGIRTLRDRLDNMTQKEKLDKYPFSGPGDAVYVAASLERPAPHILPTLFYGTSYGAKPFPPFVRRGSFYRVYSRVPQREPGLEPGSSERKASVALDFPPRTWIRGYLRRADLNQDGKMSYEEVKHLLQMINIDLSEQYARCLFKKCDRSADGRLDDEETEEFCRELLRRPELDHVFHQYSANGCVLSTAELREFLRDQGEDASLVHAQSLILTYELNEWARKNRFMTPNGFTLYMLSCENDVFDREHTHVYQDMQQPLAHYFISSSHNTYLTRDQVTSDSSTEPYIRCVRVPYPVYVCPSPCVRALERGTCPKGKSEKRVGETSKRNARCVRVRALNQGCRCVELDCWDGDNGEPMIYHGHTLTSKVTFREVIETIAQYAFKGPSEGLRGDRRGATVCVTAVDDFLVRRLGFRVLLPRRGASRSGPVLHRAEPRLPTGGAQASSFPLILSLENHCSVEQQTVMSQHLRGILGDKLLTKPLGDQPPTTLPSPEVSRRPTV